MQSVHVRNVFNLYLPLTITKEANGIVHDITSVPSVSFSLFDKDQLAQEEYYHIKLLIVDAYNVESELPGGLSWAKRRPLTLIQDSVNPHLVTGVSLRFKIPEGTIDFRRHRLRPNTARIVVSNANSGSWTNQASTPIFEIHQKKRSPESNPQNEVTIGLEWINPNTPEPDSVQDSLVLADETESTALTRTSNNSFELSGYDFSMLNENYVRIYDGNAEITGNLRALNFYKLSDRRMKTDIQSLTSKDCRKILLCIEGVEYKFKSGTASSNRKFIGYIAQEVQQAIPEAVSIIDGILHVDYQSILPYISEALRQTCTDVESIESNMKQFQRVLDNLHARFCEHEEKHSTRKKAPIRQRITPYWAFAVGSFLLLAVVVFAVVLLNGDKSIQDPKDESMQRGVLIDFYNSTHGGYWSNNNGWLSNSSVCQWYGVTCNSNGDVTKLHLVRNMLNGTIPNSLANLTSLVTVNLNVNDLSGTIPSSLGRLADLQVLHLDTNQLSGTIPPSLGELTSLLSLHLGFNQLSGTIPPSLGELNSLQSFHLYANQLSGTIPPSLGELTAILSLNFGFNKLSGTIPESLGLLPDLKELYFYANQLSGTIPQDIGELTELQKLHLECNQLSGTIPESLIQCKNMQELSLGINLLTGTIPPSLGKLSNLQYLTIEDNQLSGTIPESLGQLSNLQKLQLESNQLSGTIPESLGQLQHLQMLFLHDNRLTGTIPPSIGQLKSLQHLDVATNQLTGTIPQTLEQLCTVDLLEWLDFSRNQLTGTIPSFFGRLRQLQILSLGENQFSGTIPSSLTQLSQMNTLGINNNQLVGEIPPSLFALPKLERLYLNNNQLSGTVPSLAELIDLFWIDLSNNKFSEIPMENQPPRVNPDLLDVHCYLQNNSFGCPIPGWTQTYCRAGCS